MQTYLQTESTRGITPVIANKPLQTIQTQKFKPFKHKTQNLKPLQTIQTFNPQTLNC